METNKGDGMSDFYRFPAMAKLNEWTNAQQMNHIIQECREADEALEEYTMFPSAENRRKYGMELMDLIHATETALRVDFSDDEVSTLRDAVEKKNRERGYYDDYTN